MSKPSAANLECARVIIRQSNMGNGWTMLERNIACALDLAEAESRKTAFGEAVKLVKRNRLKYSKYHWGATAMEVADETINALEKTVRSHNE